MLRSCCDSCTIGDLIQPPYCYRRRPSDQRFLKSAPGIAGSVRVVARWSLVRRNWHRWSNWGRRQHSGVLMTKTPQKLTPPITFIERFGVPHLRKKTEDSCGLPGFCRADSVLPAWRGREPHQRGPGGIVCHAHQLPPFPKQPAAHVARGPGLCAHRAHARASLGRHRAGVCAGRYHAHQVFMMIYLFSNVLMGSDLWCQRFLFFASFMNWEHSVKFLKS